MDGIPPLPPIDFMKVGPIDASRFAKAMTLAPYVRFLGEPGQFLTEGRTEDHDHYVDLVTEEVPRCDCGDHLWRDKLCKHILAALIHEGHSAISDALVDYFKTRRVSL